MATRGCPGPPLSSAGRAQGPSTPCPTWGGSQRCRGPPREGAQPCVRPRAVPAPSPQGQSLGTPRQPGPPGPPQTSPPQCPHCGHHPPTGTPISPTAGPPLLQPPRRAPKPATPPPQPPRDPKPPSSSKCPHHPSPGPGLPPPRCAPGTGGTPQPRACTFPPRTAPVPEVSQRLSSTRCSSLARHAV